MSICGARQGNVIYCGSCQCGIDVKAELEAEENGDTE